MRPLFVYGTLLDDAQVRAVTGRTFPRRRAHLAGHRRDWPPGDFPRLVPDPGGAVDGDLVDGLDDAALAALDAYEDAPALYARVVAEVTCAGRPVACWLSRRSPRPHG